MTGERIVCKARIARMSMAEPITSESDLASVAWKPLPITLRDDELSIVEGEPQEDEVHSHENDAPEDVDVAGAGLKAKGSFIKMTQEDLVELVGGKISGGKFQKSASKQMLNKALRFELKKGGEIIIPNAKGYVLVNLNVGYGGKSKFPFNFGCMKASNDWDCDIIM